MNTRSDIYLQVFSEKLECAFSSEATRKNYFCSVRAFIEFVKTSPEKEPAVLLRKYIILKLQGREAKTVNLHRSAIVKFFELVKGIQIDTVAVPRRKEPKKLPRIMPQESIQKAIEKTLNIKHRLVLSIFFGCGIRLCEMQGLHRWNVLDKNNFIRLEDTKGQKHRIVPIPESIRAMFYEFIRDAKPEQLIFGDLCKRTFEKIVGNAFERIGEHASPHMLRHSFATFQIMSGQNPFKVQSWLGHSSIKTTQLYVSLSDAMLSESTDLLRQSGNYTNQKVI
jgi:integrase/recombinase XerD